MSNKEVAAQIVQFLKQTAAKKEVSEDYLESIDVAIDCIADAFEISKDDDSVIKSEFDGKSLNEILDQFKKNKSSSTTSATKKQEFDEETVKKAESLKLEGNKAMASKDFQAAVDKYTAALALTPNNAVYLSNRAAAYSSLRDHESAIADAKLAIENDPTYAKAYSRLGLASFALNKPKDALDAYKKGLEIEGDKPSDAMKKGYETAKKRVEDQLDLASTAPSNSASDRGDSAGSSSAGSGMPDLASLMSGLGGAGGAGGMPNIGDMLNNPQLMQYAQQMMSNPGALQNLMSNPAVQQMASQFGLGGQDGSGPDLSSLLNNPALQNLANSFGQGNSNNNNGNSGATN